MTNTLLSKIQEKSKLEFGKEYIFMKDNYIDRNQGIITNTFLSSESVLHLNKNDAQLKLLKLLEFSEGR